MKEKHEKTRKSKEQMQWKGNLKKQKQMKKEERHTREEGMWR